MTQLRDGLPSLPARMRALPVDARGYPVPFFVSWVNGKPDFRTIDEEKLLKALRFRRCWICGEPLGRTATFAIGPLGAVQRTTSEPPSHLDCARFAVRACPFMLLPRAQKQLTKDDPATSGTRSDCGGWNRADSTPAVVELSRNPGVYALWSTDQWSPEAAGEILLFKLGEPDHVEWFAEGRQATHEEVTESIRTGMIELEARMVRDPQHRFALNAQVAALLKLVPPIYRRETR